MADVNDFFKKIGGTSDLVNVPRVTAPRSGGGTTLTVDNCNWDDTTGKVFITYQLDTSNNLIEDTETVWVGVVTSSTTIGNLTRVAGAADSGNAIGDYVEAVPTGKWVEDLMDGILEQHNQDGTHSAVTATSLSASNGISMTGGSLSLAGTWDGWLGVGDSWSYGSASSPEFTITVPSGATSLYQPGDRIKLTQSAAVKYFIITKVASTTLTVYGGTDYTLANSAISAISVSRVKSPLGFPLDPSKWTVLVTDPNDRTTTSTTPSNVGSISISVPTGAWRLLHSGALQSTRAATTFSMAITTLSAENNTEDDRTISSCVHVTGASGTVESTITFSREKFVTLTSATTYYQNIWTTSSSITAGVLGGFVTTVIKAVCAYL